MTRTQKRIQNLWRRLGALIEQRSERVRKHKERQSIERELRMVKTKILRLERCL